MELNASQYYLPNQIPSGNMQQNPMLPFYIEEHTKLQNGIQRLLQHQSRYSYTVGFMRDIPRLENPDVYSYLPVYQEGYGIDSVKNGRALVTWGTMDCVVIGAYNPAHEIYLSHTLYVNSFSKNAKSTANNTTLSGRNEKLVCRGKTILQSLPRWIQDARTQMFLYSNSPETLLNRIKQLRTVYSGPLSCFVGSSWDGTTGVFRGYLRNKGKANRVVYNGRIADGKVVIGITADGFFGIIHMNFLELGQRHPYLLEYMKEFENEVSTLEEKRNEYGEPIPVLNKNKKPVKVSGKIKTQKLNSKLRRCVYDLPPPSSPKSTPPTPRRMSILDLNDEPTTPGVNRRNPFALLATNGGRQTRRRRS